VSRIDEVGRFLDEFDFRKQRLCGSDVFESNSFKILLANNAFVGLMFPVIVFSAKVVPQTRNHSKGYRFSD
jgi:hypothetical protein